MIAEARDARGFPDDRDLARALGAAQLVENRVEIAKLRLRRGRFQLVARTPLRARPPVPGIALRRRASATRIARPMRCSAPPAGTACRSRAPPAPIAASTCVNSSRGSTASMPVAFTASSPGKRPGPYISFSRRSLRGFRNSVDRLRAAVDHQDGARLHHACQVEELVALAQRLFAGTLRGALQDGDAVADLRHHAGAPRGVLLRRKDIREDRLRRKGHRQTRIAR